MKSLQIHRPRSTWTIHYKSGYVNLANRISDLSAILCHLRVDHKTLQTVRRQLRQDSNGSNRKTDEIQSMKDNFFHKKEDQE
nr:hypothetical transcript [Hymenolepis microstoma]